MLLLAEAMMAPECERNVASWRSMNESSRLFCECLSIGTYLP
jgi:hypothetical protein